MILFVFYVCVLSLHLCLCIRFVPIDLGSKKRALEPMILDTEIKTCHVDAGT